MGAEKEVKTDKYGKDAKKATKEIHEARVDKTVELLTLCYPTSEILKVAKEEWGVCESSGNNYLRKALDRIRERWNEQSRQDWVATALDRMDKVAQMSMATGQQSNAIGATNLQARLLGITGREN